LLHYFPPPPKDTKAGDVSTAEGEEETGDDDWCGTHLDHGCLTGLTSAMFVDESKTPLEELASSPDPKAGLYIHSRTGTVTKVAIPRDCLAFQTGQALEVITKGHLKAVPHFVKGAKGDTLGAGRVARNTLAVFTRECRLPVSKLALGYKHLVDKLLTFCLEPNLWEMVDETRDFAAFAQEIVSKNH
jgi:hypothetical protein